MLPPGLLVRAPARALVRAFPALAALQPVRWSAEGLLCAPRVAPEAAEAALRSCPLPTRRLDAPPGWPEPPSAWVAGWYRRSPAHAPAPRGVPELIQVPGDGFGPGDHPTTTMCLEALAALPHGAAVDAGCGSGLLAQAWARAGRGSVLALDLDPGALAQCARSLEAAGLEGAVTLRRGPIGALSPVELADRVVLANVPAAAHARLHACMRHPPRAALLSGLRPGEAPPLRDAYRRLGLSVRRVMRRGRFECWVLVGTGA